MYRIMRNIWIDEARARQRRAKTFAPEEEGENAPDPGDRRIEAAVELSDVARAMARLPDEQREVIALVLVEGFAYREAADILDIPIGTFTSRLVRGRNALLLELGAAACTSLTRVRRPWRPGWVDSRVGKEGG